MSLATKISKLVLKRNLVTIALIGISIAAFATLGDGGRKSRSEHVGLSPVFSSRNFSLRSGYNYRANSLFTTETSRKFIMLNTVVTYQKGNATYVMPLKKKVLLDKIRINPQAPRF